MNCLVSIIIPTYARPEKLKDAIDSVFRQTYKNIELTIVDDNGIGTSDQIKTQTIVNSYCTTKKINYIINERNVGGNISRNKGIVHSNGEFIAFLDDDDVWSPRFIESNLKCFTKETIGAVYCGYYSYDGKESTKCSLTNMKRGNVHADLLRGWCPTSTSLFLLRKQYVIKAGCFDENLTSFQDYDLWLRLSEKCEFNCNYEMLCIKYEGIGEQTSRNPQRRNTGYHAVVKKYEAILNKDELKLFEDFKYQQLINCLFNTIIYNHNNGISYENEINKFYKIASKKEILKLKMILRMPRTFRFLSILRKLIGYKTNESVNGLAELD